MSTLAEDMQTLADAATLTPAQQAEVNAALDADDARQSLPTPPHYEGPSAGSLTFKGHGALDFKIVVNRKWLEFWRKDAQLPGASPFMRQAQEQHPTNDDAFIEAILKNGIRVCLRENLVQLLKATGLGGTVAPATVELMPSIPGASSTAAIQVLQLPEKEAVALTQHLRGPMDQHPETSA